LFIANVKAFYFGFQKKWEKKSSSEGFIFQDLKSFLKRVENMAAYNYLPPSVQEGSCLGTVNMAPLLGTKYQDILKVW